MHVCMYMYTHSGKNVKMLLFATDFNKMQAHMHLRETGKLSGFEEGQGGKSSGRRQQGTEASREWSTSPS